MIVIKQKYKRAFYLILLLVIIAGCLYADSNIINSSPNYILRFTHSGTANYSFNIRKADGSALSSSNIGVSTTTNWQGVCQALVVTNQRNKTFNYTLSWDSFSNGVSTISYSVRATRSSASIGEVSADANDKTMDLSLRTAKSGTGNYTYELCTIEIKLDSEDLSVATGGNYTDNLIFTISGQ